MSWEKLTVQSRCQRTDTVKGEDKLPVHKDKLYAKTYRRSVVTTIGNLLSMRDRPPSISRVTSTLPEALSTSSLLAKVP